MASNPQTGRWMGKGGSIIGSIIGSYFGGPIGGKLGGMAGQMEGSNIGDVIDKKKPWTDAVLPMGFRSGQDPSMMMPPGMSGGGGLPGMGGGTGGAGSGKGLPTGGGKGA